ncbi:aldehyde dehydrogenase family protein [Micromonospora sagamiensis]|uniref:Succinate-semialdehyde dehydrogenase/glutarate-semialdehyde dehydrogenase n=1 Tax=Micromonospora sagamiensis TaxID=47875 RepID=A0A562WEG8_9ACTN|nr:aldehyde dehydrogenase family protein [Micromonospora sagamiensis]TWJ28672.1 succinate-semialdehyde dehydrogenase/glutarate-semialdehyde dehydrogenase [Micromonospora sagamiensis]BCL12422.1 NAD-dependent succinate-semialdehyde dehydrogenase [Micromonospora sagamiensis]
MSSRSADLVAQLVGDSPGSWIGGTWVTSPDTFEVHDPATGATICAVGDADAGQAATAVASAAAALDGWSSATGWQRFEVLSRATDLLGERVEAIGELISAETGKPLQEGIGEARNTVRFFEWFSHETLRLPGEAWSDVAPGRDALVLHEPIGVVLAITPWNFPAFMVACKVGAALAAGCTVVLKPAPQTPLTALAIARCFEEAGLPSGVLNVVVAGDPQRVSDTLLDAPEVACVSLTGSRRVGELVMRKAASSIKRVLLELGGNAAAVVLPDADVVRTARDLVRARFLNSGQACMAANRVYVVESTAGDLVAELTAAVDQIVLGDPRDPATTMGPLIDHAAVGRIEAQVAEAVAGGATLVTGGARTAENEASAFLAPTLLTAEGRSQPAVLGEEFFGPVLSVIRCADVDEAVRLANATEYGLAAYVFGGDQAAATAVARKLKAGSVGVNAPLVSEPALPFGGMRSSGLGRERGRLGVEEYLETKTVQMPAVR